MSWLLVLFVMGADPVIVGEYRTGRECRTVALHHNDPHAASDRKPDPAKRYACYALESLT